MVNYRLELGYRPFPMSSKNHHFQLNCLAKVSFICMRISLFTDVYRLAVSKSPAVYTLSPALDGLWRENRGSVNRLYENKSNHFHVKGFALTLACSRLRDSLVRGDLESGRGRVFPTIWEPGAGYTHPRFEREDSGHSEIFERKQVHTKRSKRRFITHIIEGSIKNCTSRDVKKHRFTREPRFLWGQASWLSDEHKLKNGSPEKQCIYIV